MLLHGGFDGYYESITALGAALQSNDYEVVLFEGPGQGRVLGSVPMTHEWEHPVAAILDAYDIDRCTIIGGSLGGYLALRAAAFEPRIVRLVCWDVMYDALDVLFHNPKLTALVRSSEEGLTQAAVVVDQKAGADPNITFLLRQGYRVMGATTPKSSCDEPANTRRHRSRTGSPKTSSCWPGKATATYRLTSFSRSFRCGQCPVCTSRSFTDREHKAAAAHCNVGNGVKSVKVIVDWLDQCQELDSL